MDRAKANGTYAGIGLAIGMGLEVLFGIMFDQIGLGLALGAAFALLFGPIVEQLTKGAAAKE